MFLQLSKSNHLYDYHRRGGGIKIYDYFKFCVITTGGGGLETRICDWVTLNEKKNPYPVFSKKTGFLDWFPKGTVSICDTLLWIFT